MIFEKLIGRKRARKRRGPAGISDSDEPGFTVKFHSKTYAQAGVESSPSVSVCVALVGEEAGAREAVSPQLPCAL